MVDARNIRVSESKEGAGVLIRTLRRSTQPIMVPKVGDLCLVHYDCALEDGTKVDSSRDRKQPLLFEVGAKNVIYGLEVAVQHIPLGALAEITIPSLYAYGHQGHPPKIPPGATLIFQLELLEIEEKHGNIIIRRHKSVNPN